MTTTTSTHRCTVGASAISGRPDRLRRVGFVEEVESVHYKVPLPLSKKWSCSLFYSDFVITTIPDF